MTPPDTVQTGLRIPTDLHIRALNQAERQDISLNAFIVNCVQAVFTAHDKRSSTEDTPTP